MLVHCWSVSGHRRTGRPPDVRPTSACYQGYDTLIYDTLLLCHICLQPNIYRKYMTHFVIHASYMQHIWNFFTGLSHRILGRRKKRRRSILLAILKELCFDLRFLRSWSGGETTFIPAILQGLRDDLRFWLFWRNVGKIRGFDDSKRVKNQTFLFIDGLGWFFRLNIP